MDDCEKPEVTDELDEMSEFWLPLEPREEVDKVEEHVDRFLVRLGFGFSSRYRL